MSELAGYNPPGYNKLRTTLLQKEKMNVQKQLEPIKSSWSSRGVSICSDGWSDVQRRPLINVMAISESGPMFIKAVDTQGHRKDKNYISKLLIDEINKIGPQNVVQVITDNAAVCKSAGGIVENKFPHIFWTPCVVHTLNLALKNICAPSNTGSNEVAYQQCVWISKLSDDAMFIKKFIMNHGMRLYMFNENSNLKMLTIADTRFASTIVMLKRFKQIKQCLKKMVISDSWDEYREDDVGKAKLVKDLILDDDFWDRIDYLLSFTQPIYTMLRNADTDIPCLHLVYEWRDSMIENVKEAIYKHERKSLDEESPFWNVVYDILIERWTKSYTPLHCLAHSLNPRYYSVEWLAENSNRDPLHKDKEITAERIKCLERYFPNADHRRKILEEFAAFADVSVDYFATGAWHDRFYLSPKQWWFNYGSAVPNLHNIALKVLAQPSSSSCCERNWSTYNFVHSMRRNKLLPSRAEDLVFVHTNLRLLSRKTPQYKEGPSKMWDVAGDAYDSMDTIGLLEVANLSLDEPEFESIVFNDVGNESTDGGDDDVEIVGE